MRTMRIETAKGSASEAAGRSAPGGKVAEATQPAPELCEDSLLISPQARAAQEPPAAAGLLANVGEAGRKAINLALYAGATSGVFMVLYGLLAPAAPAVLLGGLALIAGAFLARELLLGGAARESRRQ